MSRSFFERFFNPTDGEEYVPSSNYNLNKIVRTTAAPGLLYPVYVREVVAKDKFSIKPYAEIQAHPLHAPLFGSFTVRLDTYFIADRLYNMDKLLNRSGYDDKMDKFPVVKFGSFAGKSHKQFCVKPNSLLAHLGYGNGFCPNKPVELNAIPIKGYYDIYRNYYIDENQTTHPIMTSESTGTPFVVRQDNKFFERICMPQGDPLYRDLTYDNASAEEPYITVPYLSRFNLGGLAVRTYHPDLNNCLLHSSRVNEIDQSSRINTQDGSITFNQIIAASKMHEKAVKLVFRNTRFKDYIYSLFSTKLTPDMNIPRFLGSSESLVTFDTIMQTAPDADSTDSDNGVGNKSGNAKGFINGETIHVEITEPGYIMTLMSIIPNVDYFQGQNPMYRRIYASQKFTPPLDNIAFQPKEMLDVLCAPVVASDLVGLDRDRKYGYQPAWADYTSDVNECFGDFTSSLRYWTLSRPIGEGYSNVEDVDLSSYIQPDLFNMAFKDTSLTAENFLVQIRFEVHARRPISKKVMPSLN